jgi:hypothetical protein
MKAAMVMVHGADVESSSRGRMLSALLVEIGRPQPTLVP